MCAISSFLSLWPSLFQCIGGEGAARRMFRIDFRYKHINRIGATICANIHCDYKV